MDEVAKYFKEIYLCYDAQEEIIRYISLKTLFEALIFEEKLEVYVRWDILKYIIDVPFCATVEKAACAAIDSFDDMELRENIYYAVLEAAIKHLQTHQELFCVEA